MGRPLRRTPLLWKGYQSWHWLRGRGPTRSAMGCARWQVHHRSELPARCLRGLRGTTRSPETVLLHNLIRSTFELKVRC
jgi:hypothetical protein